MFHILGHMLFGLIVGIVAKFLMPGQHGHSIIITMILGIIGAALGGFIGRAIGLYPPGHPAGFIMAVIGAAIVLVIYGYFTRPAASQAQAAAVQSAHRLHAARPGPDRLVILRG